MTIDVAAIDRPWIAALISSATVVALPSSPARSQASR
jgi:hypothetical protein